MLNEWFFLESNVHMSTTVILGAQWGDEGKGKLVDVLAGNSDWVARFQGGIMQDILWSLVIERLSYTYFLVELQENLVN